MFLREHPGIYPSIHKSLPPGVLHASTTLKTPPGTSAKAVASRSSEKQRIRENHLQGFQATLQDLATNHFGHSQMNTLKRDIHLLEISLTHRTMQMDGLERQVRRLKKDVKKLRNLPPKPPKKTEELSQASDTSLFSTMSEKTDHLRNLKGNLKNLRSQIDFDNQRLNNMRTQLLQAENCEEVGGSPKEVATTAKNARRTKPAAKRAATKPAAKGAVTSTATIPKNAAGGNPKWDGSDTGDSTDDERRWDKKRKATRYGGCVDMVDSDDNCHPYWELVAVLW